MATHETQLIWLDDLKFDVQQNNKTLRIDGNADEATSTGVRPKALILSSLAGCTAIDIVDMLHKMRVGFTDFSIKVVGDLTDDHPRIYNMVHLHYSIRLKSAADQEKMEKAVNLSQEKYCGVSAMVKKFADLQIKIEYLPVP